MQKPTFYKVQAEMIYMEAKDFGYKMRDELVANEEDISLLDLEDTIYNHLISIPAYSSYPILCENEAQKAAKRVFDTFGSGGSHVFLSDGQFEE